MVTTSLSTGDFGFLNESPKLIALHFDDLSLSENITRNFDCGNRSPAERSSLITFFRNSSTKQKFRAVSVAVSDP